MRCINKDFRCTSSTEFEYMLLCGMQIKVAMDELIKNPLKFLRLYEKIGVPASKLINP